MWGHAKLCIHIYPYLSINIHLYPWRRCGKSGDGAKPAKTAMGGRVREVEREEQAHVAAPCVCKGKKLRARSASSGDEWRWCSAHSLVRNVTRPGIPLESKRDREVAISHPLRLLGA